MSDLKEIKKRLLRENKMEKIYEAMGCEHISYSGGRIEAQLPQRYHSDNKRAVQTKLHNESLSSSIRNRADFGKGDIYSLVSYIVHDKRGEDEYNADLHNAKTFICETLGWTEFLEGGSFKAKKDYVAPLKAILKGKQRMQEIKPNPVIPESTLDEFVPYPSYDWMKEDIPYQVQKMYGVGFDLDTKRITIPMRNRFGQLVGVKGRILNDDESDMKYMYVYKYQNRYEWFNFHFAHPYILKTRKVYIFEAEKSCMKAFGYGIYNTLAIGASEIAPEQVQIVKQLGLDIEIVLCYDKGIKDSDIDKGAELFQGRKVSAIYDTDNLLENKNSPIDQGVETWEKLLNEYVKVVEPEKKKK